MTEPDEPPWLDDRVAGALPDDGLTVWLPTGRFDASALCRVPRHPHRMEVSPAPGSLSLDAVRNEQQSGQLVVIADRPVSELSVTVEDLESGSGAVLGADVTTRFVEFLPVVRAESEYTFSAVVEDVADTEISGGRAPDLVGDPLSAAATTDVPALRAQPVWFTVEVPADAEPATYEGQVHVDTGEFDRASYDLAVAVHDVTLPDPPDYEFFLDVWLNASAVAAEHDVDWWSEPHWDLLEACFADLATHSQGRILTTITEEPWQQSATHHRGMVTWHREGGEWRFDYSVFDRFVETALAHGVGPEIAAYSMLDFEPPERLTYREDGQRVVEEVAVGGERWREAWTAFLEDFAAHLREQGWYEQTLVAVDEREAEAMDAARGLLEEVTPGLADRLHLAGVAEAGADVYDFAANFGELPLEAELLEERRAAGKRTTFYTAGAPNHPNALAMSPAVESRLLPWIAAEQDLDGYLRWAYNNWPHDVRDHPVYKFVQGDEYLVYPGADGPASSIRWELLKEGIEDYELAARLRDTDPDAEELDVALEFATREHDGRRADPGDIPRARRLLVDALTE